MRRRNETYYKAKKTEIMERSFACYCENGFSGTGIQKLADACGMTKPNFYTYFDNVEDLVIQSTQHCMTKIEDEFMSKAPEDPDELIAFLEELPYWTEQKHGKEYRLMYQIYTHPKYIEYGKRFMQDVNQRYTTYSKRLEKTLGVPYDVLSPLIFVYVHACVHYAMFGDKEALTAQLSTLRRCLTLLQNDYKNTKTTEKQ